MTSCPCCFCDRYSDKEQHRERKGLLDLQSLSITEADVKAATGSGPCQKQWEMDAPILPANWRCLIFFLCDIVQVPALECAAHSELALPTPIK